MKLYGVDKTNPELSVSNYAFSLLKFAVIRGDDFVWRYSIRNKLLGRWLYFVIAPISLFVNYNHLKRKKMIRIDYKPLCLVFFMHLSSMAIGQVYVDATATGGGNDGSSWSNAYTTLQSAIDDAAVAGGQVWVAAGTYKPTKGTDRSISFVMKNNVEIYGGFTGIETALSQGDWRLNTTILSGDIGILNDANDNSYHVIKNEYPSGTPLDNTAILDGFSIINGNVTGDALGGGGIYNLYASPIIRNCIFFNNQGGSRSGGAIYVSNSSMRISDCKFYDNTSIASSGGAISINESSGIEIINSLFYSNQSSSIGSGGAIFSRASNISVENCTLTENVAGTDGGGAILAFLAGTVTVSNSILWNNSGGSYPEYRAYSASSIFAGDYNLIEGTGIGIHDINSDPQFFNAPADDFRIFTNCSPVINSGDYSQIPAGVTTDLAGGNRTEYGQVDIGAYEFTGAGAFFLSDVKCNGQNNGQMELVSEMPVTVSFFSGSLFLGTLASSGTVILNTLSPGDYPVQVAVGCASNLATNLEVANFTIAEPEALTLAITQNNITCFGASDGGINASGSGGTLPYQYSIDGSPYSSTNVFNSLLEGNHTVGIKDANNCTNQTAITITEPSAALSISPVNVQDVDCFGGTGIQTVTASGGTFPYEYSVDGGSNYTAFSNNQTATVANIPLDAGSYTIIIRDGNMCTDSESFTVNEPALFEQDNFSLTHVNCNAGMDGLATVVAKGGTTPYQYRIITSTNTGVYQNSGVFAGLSAGDYTIDAMDNNSCGFSVNFTITEPTAIDLGVSLTPISCNGGQGAISISPSGGDAGGYEASVDGTNYGTIAQFNSVMSVLTANDYDIYVRDADGCVRMETISLSEPDEISFGTSWAFHGCSDAFTADLQVENITGGTSPYQYSLDGTNFQSPTVFAGLTEGNFNVYARDANSCERKYTISFGNPVGLQAAASVTSPSCNGLADGSMSISSRNGVGPYNYSLDGIIYQSSTLIEALSAGNYTVHVKDAAGCEIMTGATIDEPDVLTAIAVAGESEISVTANGGTPPYSYTVDGQNFQEASVFTGLMPDDYTVLVRDFNNCESSAETTIVLALIHQKPNSILVYPNPAYSQFVIPDHEDIVLMNMYNMQGRLVLTQSFANQRKHLVDVSSLDQGLFWVEMFDQNGQILSTNKFLKQ